MWTSLLRRKWAERNCECCENISIRPALSKRAFAKHPALHCHGNMASSTEKKVFLSGWAQTRKSHFDLGATRSSSINTAHIIMTPATFFINLHFLLSFPVVWHHCELEPGLNFLQFSAPSALIYNTPCLTQQLSPLHGTRRAICLQVELAWPELWDRLLGIPSGTTTDVKAEIVVMAEMWAGQTWDGVSFSQRVNCPKQPQNLNSQRNCSVLFRTWVFSFFFPAFPVRELMFLDCQLATMLWSVQKNSSAVPLQKPPHGQKDFCVHVRAAPVCAGERWEYIGDLNAYLYFSFKLVGIRHIIQHIAFKISAVACWMLCHKEM